jgi:hypothetical protein
MQDDATTHTAYYSINVLNEAFGDRLKSHRFWQDFLTLIPVTFYLLGNLKSKVYSNNPHTLDEFKHIFETITSTEIS